jgi:RNA-splicing ligase RtcB
VHAKDTASMPFVHPHVALMPDAHGGKGSATGTRSYIVRGKVNQVMADAADRVEVEHVLRQMLNVKGQ